MLPKSIKSKLSVCTRKEREGKKEKKQEIKKKDTTIDRTEICKVDPSILSADAEYRGYEPVDEIQIL